MGGFCAARLAAVKMLLTPPGPRGYNQTREARHGHEEAKMKAGTAVFVLTLAFGLLAAPQPVDAQQPAKIPRIGVLALGYPPTATSRPDPMDGFRQGLRELGYVEGRNVIIEWRYAARQMERLPQLAAGLAQLHVDVIHAGDREAAEAARTATSTIPIVVLSDTGPVAERHAASRARSGGNITGLTVTDPEVSGKQLQLLKEAFPKLSRVAALWDSATLPPSSPRAIPYMKAMKTVARALGVRLHVVEVRGGGDFASAFEAVVKAHAQALHVTETAMLHHHRARLADLATESQLPTIGSFRPSAEAGFLMTYGADLRQLHRRAATYVDKLLKGANASDLPIGRPTKLELVINQRTAKALSLAIPPSLLIRADELIE